jgi:hypothetical protein
MAQRWSDDRGTIDSDPLVTNQRFLVSFGATSQPAGLVGVVAKLLSPSRSPFALLHASEATDRVALSRLLGLAALDDAHEVIHATVMPMRPGFAVLRDDGSFRHQVTRSFAPWVTAEVSRLSRRMLPYAAQMLEQASTGVGPYLRSPGPGTPFSENELGLFEFDLPDVPVDLTGMRLAWEGLERHRVVRLEYQRDRYMAHLDRKDLDIRARSLFRGQYQVDSLGRITLERTPQTHMWIDKLTEVMQEYALRGIGYEEMGRSISQEESLRRGRDVFRVAGEVTGRYRPPKDAYLVKYAPLAFASELLERGRLRMGPAASYDDPSLNSARRDDEMGRLVDWDSTILPFSEDGAVPSFKSAPRARRFETITESSRNFYVYCLSGRLLGRLFNDFEANAAVVIRDRDVFLRRLTKAVNRALPRWRLAAGPVEYFDPLNTSPSEVQIPFWKAFEYAYQEEMRIAVHPPIAVTNLNPLFLELGPLDDIAELILLPVGNAEPE